MPAHKEGLNRTSVQAGTIAASARCAAHLNIQSIGSAWFFQISVRQIQTPQHSRRSWRRSGRLQSDIGSSLGHLACCMLFSSCIGGWHGRSAGVAFACHLDGSGWGACGGANGDIDSRFLRLMEPRGPERLGTAAVGTRPREEQVARANGTASRRGQWRPIGGRLQQSDLAALGSASRQEVRRDFARGKGLSDPAQPVLARAGTFRLRIMECSCSSSRTWSPSFTRTIISSARCA